jgi:uncharacterized lipoprotein (TIGR02269 family)
MRLWILLLCGLLTACASATPAERRWEAASAETRECDDPGADRCVTVRCGIRLCGVYHCADVRPGRIVRAQAVAPLPPPPPLEVAVEPFPETANPQRYWGSTQGLPNDAEPIFIIPWNQTNPAPNSLEEEGAQDKRTWAKHHVFPQEFRAWFELKGIDIHAWTMVLEKSVHERIHFGRQGGPWNAAWREYINDNKDNKKLGPQAIHLFAVRLIFRFELSGPVVPYRRKLPLVFPGAEEDPY